MNKIWVDRAKCTGCKTCEIACATERDSVGRTLLTAIKEEHHPIARVGVFGETGEAFPLQCRQCEDAPCLKACPSGALARDEETNTVHIDAVKCVGCWMCVMSCPFGVITPSEDYHVAMKCDACYHMERPACVAACPTGALMRCTEEEFATYLKNKKADLKAEDCSLESD